MRRCLRRSRINLNMWTDLIIHGVRLIVDFMKTAKENVRNEGLLKGDLKTKHFQKYHASKYLNLTAF